MTAREALIGARDTSVRQIEVRRCLDDPLLNVMNFLNEVVADFPAAISFAPGRPFGSPFRIDDHAEAISSFVAHRSERDGVSPEAIRADLAQYGRTNGIIADLIALQLETDEGIRVAPKDVIVTVGAQEAMAILIAGLFEPGRDRLLVSDPSYIGITGLARLFGVDIVAVPSGAEGLEADVLEAAIVQASRGGRVRAVYDVPDFNNPTGTCLSIADRLALLEVCTRHGVLVIEDNPYGMFAYDDARRPTLKALDDSHNVIYIGSFSKTLFPGLRVGYLVADQRVTPGGESLAAALSRVKSLLTVNSPPMLQAAAGGMLLQSGGTLEPIVAPKRAQYRLRRNAMRAALEESFADARHRVSWQVPAGGFFLPVTLPFDFGERELRRCALDFGVIVSPMRFFCVQASRERQIRLAFSYVSIEEIREGIARLARFVAATPDA